MQTGARLPKFVLMMFVSVRAGWVIDSTLEPEQAHRIFDDTMSGRTSSRTAQAANALGGRGMKWRVTRSDDVSKATCTGGRPTRILRPGGPAQKIQPDGQEIDFETRNQEGARHQYELIAADLTVVSYLLFFSLSMFSGQFRYFFRRVIRNMRAADTSIQVDYPVSILKVVFWIAVLVLILMLAF